MAVTTAKSGAPIEILVREGNNSQPSFSPNGEKLVFVSGQRSTHKQNQVYEKDLKTGAERRLTFQNGDTFQPQYHPKDNVILYSSSTDELKENPPFLHPAAPGPKMPYPYAEPMEIYVHALQEFDIDRLTLHPGFDGEARFSPDGNSVTFTRVDGRKSQIVSYHLKSHAVKVLKDLGVNPTEFVASSNGKVAAWVEWDADFATSRLRVRVGKAAPREVAIDAVATKTDLSFSKDGQWLFWSEKEIPESSHTLWIADVKTLCPRRLSTPEDGDRRDPELSPNGKWLVFTLGAMGGGRSQIARQSFVYPTGPCPTAN